MKIGRYYRAVWEKYGFFIPAFVAALAFAAVFAMDYMGIMGLIASWGGHTNLFLAVLSIVLVLTVIAVFIKIPKPGVNYVDALLMAGLIFTILLIVQFCLLGFSVTKTIFLVIGAAVLILLLILRILRFSSTSDSRSSELFAEEKGVKSYYRNLFARYNVIVLVAIALFIFGALFLLVGGDLLGRMTDSFEVCVSVLIIFCLILISIIFELPKRFKTQHLSVLDGVMFVADISLLLSLITLIMNFSVLLLLVWAALFILFVLTTYIFTQKTAYALPGRATDANQFTKKFGMVTYYKTLNKKFDLLFTLIFPIIAFYAIYALMGSGILSQIKNNNLVLLVLGLCLVFVIVFGIVIMQLRSPQACVADALLFCGDVGALLLAIFVVFNGGFSALKFYPWLACTVACLAFTTVRILSVYEKIPVKASGAILESVDNGNKDSVDNGYGEKDVAFASEKAVEREAFAEPPAHEFAVAKHDEDNEKRQEFRDEDNKSAEIKQAEGFVLVDRPLSEEVAAVLIPDFSKRRTLTFEEKYMAVPEEQKLRIDALRDQAESYRYVRTRVAKKGITFRYKRVPVAMIRIAGKKSLRLYLALDPNEFPASKYHHKNLENKKSYAKTPMMVRVTSQRGFKYAGELLDVVMAQKQIVKKRVKTKK